MPDDTEGDLDDETQALLTSDFEIGHYIRERIVPRAVLYYTGNLEFRLRIKPINDNSSENTRLRLRFESSCIPKAIAS